MFANTRNFEKMYMQIEFAFISKISFLLKFHCFPKIYFLAKLLFFLPKSRFFEKNYIYILLVTKYPRTRLLVTKYIIQKLQRLIILAEFFNQIKIIKQNNKIRKNCPKAEILKN